MGITEREKAERVEERVEVAANTGAPRRQRTTDTQG